MLERAQVLDRRHATRRIDGKARRLDDVFHERKVGATQLSFLVHRRHEEPAQGEIPDECEQIRDEGVAWCAYIGGYSNIDSLDAASRIDDLYPERGKQKPRAESEDLRKAIQSVLETPEYKESLEYWGLSGSAITEAAIR